MQLQNSNLGTTVFVCGRLYQLGNTILRQTNWANQTQINKKIQNYHEVFFSITWVDLSVNKELKQQWLRFIKKYNSGNYY